MLCAAQRLWFGMDRVERKRSLPAQLLSEVAVSLVVYGMMAVPMLIMWELALQHASDQAAPADSNRATFAVNVEREGQRIVGEARCADEGPAGTPVVVLEAKLCITPETGSPTGHY